MKKSHFTRTQTLPISAEEAWNFFSIPVNMSRIAPPELGINVVTEESKDPVYEGMRILHYIRPLFGIRVPWVKHVVEVEHGNGYTYVQSRGPYRYWRHQLSFVPMADGVNIRDEIDYALPFGALGRMLLGRTVKRKIAEVFDSRERILNKMFPSHVVVG